MAADYGHIKISRKMFADDAFWGEPREFSKAEAWLDLIQRAAWKDHTRMVGMHMVTLRRGELLASVRYLATAWGWSRSKVQRFLWLLSNLGHIAGQRETPDGTVYLVVKYDRYQSAQDTSEPESGTDSGTRTGQHRDKEKAGKARKERESVRARVVPDDFEPNETHQRIAAERHVDVELEAEKFRDYSASTPKAYADHDRAFNNWLRRAEPSPNGKPTRKAVIVDD